MSIAAANCSLNLSPPTTHAHASTSSSNPSSRTSQLNPWVRNEAAWRRQCVVGAGAAACITIVLALSNGNESHALSLTNLVPNLSTNITEEQVSSLFVEQIRWSDKRSCPPWSVNSFELTVPENLPRPHTHRRWEPAGHGSSSGSGSDSSSSLVKFVAKPNAKCFSM